MKWMDLRRERTRLVASSLSNEGAAAAAAADWEKTLDPDRNTRLDGDLMVEEGKERDGEDLNRRITVLPAPCIFFLSLAKWETTDHCSDYDVFVLDGDDSIV